MSCQRIWFGCQIETTWMQLQPFNHEYDVIMTDAIHVFQQCSRCEHIET